MKLISVLFFAGSTSAWTTTPPYLTTLRPMNKKVVNANSPDRRQVVLYSDRFSKDLEERSLRSARGGAGETAAGAVLGGLLFGPFGALFGAQIGANLGVKNAVEQARTEEMKRMGISQEMLDAAQDCGVALQQSMEGLKATQESLSTLQSIARRLDRESNQLYESATDAMNNDNESAAREFLMRRSGVQDKLKKTLLQCAEEKRRKDTMELNVEAIKTRAMEIEALLQRSIGAKSRQSSADFMDLSLPDEDPLLRKFREAGIE